MNAVLTIWTIYYNPIDYPGKFVLRGHDIPGGPRPSCVIGNTIEDVRSSVPYGLYRMSRQINDEPHIVESWV
jgi:hypothetical protein